MEKFLLSNLSIKGFAMAVAVVCFIAGCKKTGGRGDTPPAPIYFEVLNNTGKNIIHSLKDTLTVNYVMNGEVYTSPLTIYKVQMSPSDTASVTAYDGFIVTDLNPSTHQGYISSPSGGGVRTFNLYLNGKLAGTIYLDYWGYQSLPYPPPLSSTFTFNGTPVKLGSITGIYTDGSTIKQEDNYPNANQVYILQ